jgi:hypothetical protein
MRFRRILGSPPLHLLIAAIFFFLFNAPLLGTPGSPSSTLLRMFGAWALSLVALGVLALATNDVEREE